MSTEPSAARSVPAGRSHFASSDVMTDIASPAHSRVVWKQYQPFAFAMVRRRAGWLAPPVMIGGPPSRTGCGKAFTPVRLTRGPECCGCGIVQSEHHIDELVHACSSFRQLDAHSCELGLDVAGPDTDDEGPISPTMQYRAGVSELVWEDERIVRTSGVDTGAEPTDSGHWPQ